MRSYMGLRTVAADGIQQSGNCGLQPSASMHWTQCQCGVGWHGEEGLGHSPSLAWLFPMLTAVANNQDRFTSHGSVLGSPGNGSQTGTQPRSLFTSAQTSPVAWGVLSIINLFPPTLVFLSGFECCLLLTGYHRGRTKAELLAPGNLCPSASGPVPGTC